MTKLSHLLINCDLDWVVDRYGFEKQVLEQFERVTVVDPATSITDSGIDSVTHWITNPAPRFKITSAFTSNHMPKLRVIGSPSTGITHIEPFDAQAGIKVYCLQDTTKENLNKITASSEFTFLLFLSIVRKAKTVHQANLEEWRDDLKKYRGRQVSGMEVLIFGNGRIGSNLGRYLNAMGARVSYYEPDARRHIGPHEFIAEDRIDATLAKVDAAFLCFHWNADNENFFDRARLNAMRDDAFLVNTSRGENLDEDYLCDLIEAGKFAGIGLDVLRNEQSAELSESRIFELERSTTRLTITPHIAGSSSDSERLAFQFIYDLVIQA